MSVNFYNFKKSFLDFLPPKILQFSFTIIETFYYLHKTKLFVEPEYAELQGLSKMVLSSRQVNSDMTKIIFEDVCLSVSEVLCGWYEDEPCLHLKKLIYRAQ